MGDANAFASLLAVNGELIVPGKRWQGAVAIAQVIIPLHEPLKRIECDGAPH